MKKIVVIGLGNTLMSDEGVGIHLLHRLKARASGFPGVDFVDLGASGLRLVHALAGRKRAILLDCARMGETPGTIRRFTPEEVRTGKKLPGFSLHEGDVLQAIALSRTLGECPESIVVFGIQPERIEPGQALSACLQRRLPDYGRAVRDELKTNALTHT